MRVLAVFILSGALVFNFAGPTLANEQVLKPGFEMCVEEAVKWGRPVVGCVGDAMSQCAEYPDGEAAQLVCYLSAKSEWGQKLKDLLSTFSDREEELQEVVRIEAKYAVLRNLMNCDLRMELGTVGRDPEPTDQITRAQCEAIGTAASLVEVLFKSGTITK